MCLGMHLARLETRVLVNRVLDRLRDLTLEPGDSDPHIRGDIFRSPTALPVTFNSAGLTHQPVSRAAISPARMTPPSRPGRRARC